MTKFRKFLLSTHTLAFSTLAFAQENPAGAPPSPTQGLLLQAPIFVAIIALFYFGMIRPQRNQQKQHTEFLQKLGKGDDVVTTGGILGKIIGINDRVVTLDVSNGNELKVLRTQVQAYLKDALPST